MTTSDQTFASMPDETAEVEVIKDLEQRGLRGLETLSLEELQLLTERKRKQIHLEATEKKASLESEISGIDETVQQLNARKVALTEELQAVVKSLGLPANGADRTARRTAKKPKKSVEADVSAAESDGL